MFWNKAQKEMSVWVDSICLGIYESADFARKVFMEGLRIQDFKFNSPQARRDFILEKLS
jgi:hypothetical protein